MSFGVSSRELDCQRSSATSLLYATATRMRRVASSAQFMRRSGKASPPGAVNNGRLSLVEVGIANRGAA